MRRFLARAALTVAAFFSVATQESFEEPPALDRSAWAAGTAFLVSPERPAWRFVVEATTTVPGQLRDVPFGSRLLVDVVPQVDAPLVMQLVDCDDGEVLDEDPGGELVRFELFRDCPFDEPCVVATCLDVSSDGSVTVPVQWGVEVRLEAERSSTTPFDLGVTVAEEAP